MPALSDRLFKPQSVANVGQPWHVQGNRLLFSGVPWGLAGIKFLAAKHPRLWR